MSRPHDAVDPATVIRYTEKEFENQVVELAKDMGWLVYHVRDSRYSDWRSDKGFPDWVFAKEGHSVIFAELKGTKGRATKAQIGWIETLHAATARAGIFWPEDWGTLSEWLIEEVEA